MKILIGADIVPTKSNIMSFEHGDIGKLVDKRLFDVLSQADYRIFNLEVPLTDTDTPILKCGPNLIASIKSVAGIKAIGADFLTLANNHILDQGVGGLQSTKKVLMEHGICFAGIGNTLEEAAKPFIMERDSKKIGIYCCAEHEFSIVSEYHAGANPFDPLESLDHVTALKQKTDYVIVLYHGGKEQYRYPSPNLQKVCRKLVDKGADLVICQHTHCIGCKEDWNGGTIVYGQGNFLFDDCDNEFWSTSLLVQLDFKANNVEIAYLPIEKRGASVALASEKKDNILKAFYERSEAIKMPSFIQSQYNQISEEQFDRYMNMLQGKRYNSFLFRVLNKLSDYKLQSWLLRHKYGKQEFCSVTNILDCEVHRECFLNALNRKFHYTFRLK